MNEAMDINNWRDDSDDYRAHRDWWWSTLRILRRSWLNTETGDFDAWLAETYGVTIVYDSGGLISDRYEVCDSPKHLIFLLKYR